MKTILLVDDEPHLRLLVHTTLKDPSHRILEAPDGPTGLSVARAEHPDLVVLDLIMPGMDGLQVARALREDPATSSIPVLILTARNQDALREQARAAGVEAFLAKPFSPLELLERVRDLLRQPVS